MTPEYTPDPTVILDPLPIDSAVKADAWDAFHVAAGHSHFKALMDPLALPDEAKADLYDMKFGSPHPEQLPTSGSLISAASKPTKPNQVQRVSPATPNPPTAATATEPEQPATIDIQLQQLGSGLRRVVMFPKGHGQPAQLPVGSAITHDNFGNTYAYRPDLVKKSEIHTAARNNTLPEILGGPQGMGAPDKSALMGRPISVTALSPEGVEVQSTATDEANIHRTVTATAPLMPKGGSMRVEPVAAEILRRTITTGPLAKAVMAFASADPIQKTSTAAILRRRLASADASTIDPATRAAAQKYFNLRPSQQHQQPPQDFDSPTPIQ